MSITFISAGAGSGKTYRLVEEIVRAVGSGKARPEAVVATTFSRMAARELRERITAGLDRKGLNEASTRLDLALIGTVHSICSQLLARFALEAGLSPDLRHIEEFEVARFLDLAVESEVSEPDQLELFRLSDRLTQKDSRTGSHDWASTLCALTQEARANEIRPGDLAAMGEASWVEMQAALPPAAAAGEEDIRQVVLAGLKAARAEISGSEKVGTTKYGKYLRRLERAISPGTGAWADWVKSPERGECPEVAFKHVPAEVEALVNRVAEHPDLHRDIEAYLRLLFTNAARVAARFQALKQERGVVDYQDLEWEALRLLRNHPEVRDLLRAEMDLFLVDEFQDTSPIQLSLFRELGALAGNVIWVGDVKQSIYAFRGADPELIFRAVADVQQRDTLNTSYRSVPELVHLTNDHFAPAFQHRLGLPEEETRLKPQPDAPAATTTTTPGPAFHPVALENNDLYKSGARKGNPKRLEKAKRAEVIADLVGDILEDPPGIRDRATSRPRPLRPSDIAILCRTNQAAANLAEALRNRGRDVALSSGHLLGTPECRFALAALRTLTDPTDTLAAAEVVALETGPGDPESWLQHRLDYLRDHAEDDPEGRNWAATVESLSARALVRERETHETLRFLSPLQVFDLAVEVSQAVSRVSRWGPSEARAQARLANLGQLREHVLDYETQVATFGLPATLNGLLGHLQQLAEDEQDQQAQTRSADALFVGTYHKSKGLEWPVVLLTDLDAGLRHRLFDLRARTGPDGNRELRLWVHPFGGGTGPVTETLEQSAEGQRQIDLARAEDLRLLYVGFTRARDHLYLLHEPAVESSWLAELGPEAVGALCQSTDPPKTYADPSPPVAPSPTLRLPRLPGIPESASDGAGAGAGFEDAASTPSAATPVPGAVILARHDFGRRLTLPGHRLDEQAFGNAMHRFLAAEILNPDVPDREHRLARILESHGLRDDLRADEVLAMSEAFRRFVGAQFQPARHEVEVPFTVTHESNGQRVTGFIDSLLHTPGDGGDVPIVIDHKIFPGRKSEQDAEALGYSGQLQGYRQALIDAGGADDARAASPARTFIHFVTSGVLLEVGFPGDPDPERATRPEESSAAEGPLIQPLLFED